MLPRDVFPARLTALHGWPRGCFNEAFWLLCQCENEEQFRHATEFIQSVSNEIGESFMQGLRAEWARVKRVFDEQRELQRRIKHVYG